MPGKDADTLRQQLEQAIAVQESLRGSLDDAIIDATSASLKAQLDTLHPSRQQRKLATILFMDIAGHTALTADLDPEEQMGVVDPAIVRLASKVNEHGGHVARYQGDGFKAVFGLPTAMENDSRQAVRAGLAIQKEATEIAEELQKEKGLTGFQVRVGITTGPVFAGGETEGEDTIKGPAVNLAARLESAAEPGTVLISRDTFKHVRGSFDVKPLDPITVKGFSEPVSVYCVLKARPRSFYKSGRGIVGVETEMVGREGEMKALKDACKLVELDQQVQVVTLVGPAGIGKSRLMFEFENWLSQKEANIRIFHGRCARGTQHTPNSLLRDLLAEHWDVLEDDSTEVANKKIYSSLRESLPDDADLQIKTDFIGYFLGYHPPDTLHPEVVHSDPQQVRDRAIKYLIEYFINHSLSGTVILMLEDIHWADDSSLDFLNELTRRTDQQALLVACAARPSLYQRRAFWGEGQDFHTRVDLPPLSKLDSRRLVAQILEQEERLPAELHQMVSDHAEGNPYFLEEFINLQIEQGVIAKQAGTWSVVKDKVEKITVPQTLTEVLQARLDRLPEQEKKLLQQASVIGRVFWDEILQHVWTSDHNGETHSDIRNILERLRDQAFIYRREFSAFDSAIEHSFIHDLLREVAYESVLLTQRKHYHGLIARWLIHRLGTELHDHHALIAEHLIQAGSEDRAIDFLMEAAESAAMRFANEEALSHYNQILQWPEKLYSQHKWTLYCGREKVLDFLGNREEQFRELSRLQSYALETADLEKQVEAGLRLLNYSEETRNYPEELKTGKATLELAQQGSDPILVARASLALGRILALQRGDLEEAIKMIESASSKFVQLGEYRLAGHANRALGVVYSMENDLTTAIDRTRLALEFARKSHDQLGEVYALTNLSGLLNSSGDWQGSLEILKQSHLLVRKIGNRRGEAYILGSLSSRAIRVGDYAHAEDHSRECLRLLREINDQRVEIDELVKLSFLATKRKSYQEALSILEEADSLIKQIEISEDEVAHVMDAYCEIYSELTDYSLAVEYGLRAVQLRKNQKESKESILSRVFLAEALLGAQQLSEALEQVDDILKYLEKQETFDQDEDAPRIRLVCYKVLAACSDPRAAELLAGAHQSLDQLSRKFASETDRLSYLEKVSWHKEIVELWREEGNVPDDDVPP